ncbi:diguanylate cyclase (GGDEF) domain-containing protein [Desulfurobacterium pacificum]|uniref:Diguanylate cyclase (GGDEF) domain-containing protein n=1 Tax=Desulfurobacterium pacificum TaxID=240166 RepID=A0ABY1NVP8_9BACT|nr:GGDEF domain-containing phosphodiesterase [Desulfurobacterium pacificum]SMP19530.1 diguanylate cyclase (GGDEF) domain-containing protein [Desulfurobacterium pacificum]
MEWRIFLSEEIVKSSECIDYFKDSYIIEFLRLLSEIPQEEALETLKRKLQSISKSFNTLFPKNLSEAEIPVKVKELIENNQPLLLPSSLTIVKVDSSFFMLFLKKLKNKFFLALAELDCSVAEDSQIINESLVIEYISNLVKNGDRFLILSVDIENFSRINDSYGIKAGDRILSEILKRLKETLEDCNSKVFRFYSDKFIIVHHHDCENPLKELKPIVSKVLDVFKEPFSTNGKKVYVVPNIGASFFPEHGESVLVKAELAQKEAFLRQVPLIVFSEDIGISEKVLEILTKIKEDLKENRITIYLQPKVDLNSGEIIGAEALMRCSVPPGEAIPVITEYGLLFDVGEVILKKSLNVLRRLERLNVNIPISVNVSYSQLIDKRFIPLIDKLIKNYRINPELLVFEITETEATKCTENLMETLEEIKKRKIKLSIDDFGTGYSSLSRLKLLKAWEIKIDKSFILNLDRNIEDKSIVKFIIDIGKLLSLEVVAEGIEKQEQIDILKELGCYKGQGFFFYPPLPVEEFFNLITKKR